MSRAGSLQNELPSEVIDTDSIEVGIATVCEECHEQPDTVRYNRLHKLLFWECPNGHKGWIEEFEIG